MVRIVIEKSMHHKLQTFIDGSVIRGDKQLRELLIEANNMRDCALYVPDFYSGEIVYLGKEVDSFFEISAEEFMQKGVELIVRHTSLTDLPRLSAQQSMYIQRVQDPDYDLVTVLLQHYQWTTISPGGKHIPTQTTGVILTFNDNREFLIGVGFILLDEAHNKSLLLKCQDLLTKIKDRHNVLDRPLAYSKTDIPFIIQYTDRKYLSITRRERQLLLYLSKGLSTKELAVTLQISEHTIETHRKHLLQKFEAKNTAELIKKASKVFWLE